MNATKPLDNHIILHALTDATGKTTVVQDGFIFGGQKMSAPQKKSDMTMPPVPSWTDNGVRWAWWGDDDKLPTKMRELVEQVDIAGATLDKKIKMMAGNGLVYYKTKDMANGPNVERAWLPEVEDWMEENRTQTEWFPAQCGDFCLPYNCFSEMILSRDRSKVTGLYHRAAEHSRLSKANAANEVDYLLYSYHFPFGTAQSDQSRVATPLYKWYDRQAFLEGLRGRKFGWHTRMHTPGMIYYARAWWLGLFKTDGWMNVSADVPRIVRAMQKNQIALKYIIAIPESYFELRHGDKWMGYTPDEKQTIIQKKVDEINEYLTGVDNVFKSISYVFKEHEVTGNPIGKIEVLAVDDKAKEGTWIPDSYTADAHIVQGFGMDPSQIGLAPEGGKMGAGSGSDKRESYNLMVTLNTLDQRLVLEPLNWISRYNGWGVTFMVDHTTHTTTNNVENGLVPSQQTTQVQPAK